MSVLTDQIEKAIRRDAGVDVKMIAASNRDAPPDEVASDRQKAERLRFLRDSLGDPQEAMRAYERIIHGNEIQAINYLAKGARVAEAVARIAIKDGSGRTRGWGTGFLIAPGVLLTNNHVLPSAGHAMRSEAHFHFELDLLDRAIGPQVYALRPDQLFFTDEPLDFTVVAVAQRGENSDTPLDDFGFLPLIGETGKVADGEWLTVIQHPNGERKQVCVRENKLLKRTGDVLWYSTDTLGGSSGSPVFNNDWYVVALHHSGIPETRDGNIQTLSGQDYDPARDSESTIKWVANEGIRVSRIFDTLRAALPQHPLLQPMLKATPAYARLQLEAAVWVELPSDTPTATPSAQFDQENVMNAPRSSASRHVDLTLEIDADGEVRVSQVRARENESAMFMEARKSAVRELDAELPFDSDYDKREGFKPDFLGDDELKVNLPELSPALVKAAAKLLADENEYVLKYHNFSVVMHAKRRFAIYTAANLDAGNRYDMSRPADVWRMDPRISEKEQIGNFFYRNNKFDRGHLTRREDLEFGKTFKKALASAADTCHWTNCTPQHEKFNQNRQLWQGLERYILEETVARDGELHVQVFTGPLLDEDDPVYDAFPKVRYPVRFWKVVVALNTEGKLSATGYLLDQSEVIAQYGIEAAPEAPFGAFRTFQVRVAEIERLTGLKFTYGDGKALTARDPLNKTKRKLASHKPNVYESMVSNDLVPGYLPLDRLESLILDDKA